MSSEEPFVWQDPRDGLPLLVATSPEWAPIALADLDSVLIDHAFCEHKAAVTALGLIGRFAQYAPLVQPMLALAREEMVHMRQVIELLDERGLELGAPRPDVYVRTLRRRFCSEGEGVGGLGDSLLVCAFVEARSCERFRLLAQALVGAESPEDDKLGRFYRQLAEAEGRHWELFRDLALELLPDRRIPQRLEELAQIEGEVVRDLPVAARMH